MKTIRVLFLGNSHTFYNDMPAIVRDLAAERGVDLRPTMLTMGGMGLDWHARMEQTRFNILYGQYDVAVLQHKAHPMGDLSAMEDGAKTIAAMLAQAATRIVLYETWTRKGDEASQPAMSAAYERLAAELPATLAPVGDRWQAYRLAHPSVELYAEDGGHASPAGSRLAAETLLDAILQATST